MSEQEKPLLSILIPTRGRYPLFENMISHLIKTLTIPYDIHVGLDKQDNQISWYISFCKKQGYKYYVFDRIGISAILNLMAYKSEGKYVIGLDDDVLFTEGSEGWAQVLIEKMEAHRDGVTAALTCRDNPTAFTVRFVMLSRIAMGLQGYYVPYLFEKRLLADRWLASIYATIGRLYMVTSVPMDHAEASKADVNYHSDNEKAARLEEEMVWKHTASVRNNLAMTLELHKME